MAEFQQNAADSGADEDILEAETDLLQRCRRKALKAAIAWNNGDSIDYWGQSIPANSLLALPRHAEVLAIRFYNYAGQMDPILAGALATVGRAGLMEVRLLANSSMAMPAETTQDGIFKPDPKTLAAINKRIGQVLIKFAKLYVLIDGRLYSTPSANFSEQLAEMKERVSYSDARPRYGSLPAEFRSAIEESKDVAVVFDPIKVEVKAVIKRLDDAEQRLSQEEGQIPDADIAVQRDRLIDLQLGVSKIIRELSMYIVGE